MTAELHLVVIARAQLCLFFQFMFYVPNGQESKYYTHFRLILCPLLSDHCPHANVVLREVLKAQQKSRNIFNAPLKLQLEV